MWKTTVQISQETLNRLKALKKYERESYKKVLNNLIDEAEEDYLTKEEIEEIQEGLEQIKRGEVYPIEQVAKELGITLK